MKKIKWILGIVVVLVLLSVMKNVILQFVIETSLSKAAHVPVKIGATHFSLSKRSIDLRDIRIMNPSSFTDRVMLDAPQVAIAVVPSEFLKGRAHFTEARLNLKEIVVVKNKDGQLNVNALKPKTEGEKPAARPDEKPSAGTQPTKLQIDKLYLTIGRVVYKDYSAGSAPAVQTFDINMKDREFTNITDPKTVISLIMFEALTRTTLSRLTDLDLNNFKDGAVGVLAGSLGLVGDSAQSVGDKAKKLLNLFQ